MWYQNRPFPVVQQHCRSIGTLARSTFGQARRTGFGRNRGERATLIGLEQDRGKRFALWSFLHMFGSAPDLDVAFESEEDREAARNFMDLLAASEGDGAG